MNLHLEMPVAVGLLLGLWACGSGSGGGSAGAAGSGAAGGATGGGAATCPGAALRRARREERPGTRQRRDRLGPSPSTFGGRHPTRSSRTIAS